MYKIMSGIDVFDRQQQNILYNLIYNLRPDRKQVARGDSYDPTYIIHFCSKYVALKTQPLAWQL